MNRSNGKNVDSIDDRDEMDDSEMMDDKISLLVVWQQLQSVVKSKQSPRLIWLKLFSKMTYC